MRCLLTLFSIKNLILFLKRVQMHAGSYVVFKRSGLEEFLRFCHANFKVAVWTSRLRYNAQPKVDKFFKEDRLLFFWDQLECKQLTSHPPKFVKRLEYVWRQYHNYNESNTILLDDSPSKAIENPLCTTVFPKTYLHSDPNDNILVPVAFINTWKD